MNLSPEKLLVIAVLALLVLGPNRLPAAARSLGKMLAQLRSVSGSLQGELREALGEPGQALQHAVDEFGIRDLRSSVRGTISSVTSPFTAPSGNSAATPATAAPVAGEAVVAGQVGAAAVVPPPDDPALN